MRAMTMKTKAKPRTAKGTRSSSLPEVRSTVVVGGGM